MDYKLIAIDIDGTLLTSQRTITPRTENAIQRAIAGGTYVFLCTGRSLHSGRSIAGQVHASTGLVFHSGALILEHLNGTVLRAINLPLAWAQGLIVFFKDQGHDPLVYGPVLGRQHFFHEAERSPNEWRRRYIGANQEKAQEVPDLETATTQEPAQIGVAGSGEEMERLQTHLAARWPDAGLILSRSTLVNDYWFLEVVPPDVSKSKALAFLSETYNIEASEMIAVGDNFNDLDMIQYAGLGVAVKNAPECIRTVADFISPTNDEEGVACVIEKFLL
ncbi:uncharacterized protein METZ01_LOCUS234352 [marine metagenome]|uniref:Uncharacterized protein n=1 Tax=marine metagenome TaxID=408172 RepID=A0A382H2I8_9ZZZZ